MRYAQLGDVPAKRHVQVRRDGRLLVEEIARRPWTAAQPECRYDDFTADIEENRVLAAAVPLDAVTRRRRAHGRL